jgi:hypothetical protein
MDPKVGVAFPSNNGNFSLSVTGPDGVSVATPLTCFTWDSFSRYADFRGNGNYTVTVTNYPKADTTCKTPTSTETYVYTINSSVSIAPPPGPFGIRAPNSFSTNGSYRSIGKTTISSQSTFGKRFRQRRTGSYRLRIHYAGSSLAPPATITYKIRITRRLFYR